MIKKERRNKEIKQFTIYIYRYNTKVKKNIYMLNTVQHPPGSFNDNCIQSICHGLFIQNRSFWHGAASTRDDHILMVAR